MLFEILAAARPDCMCVHTGFGADFFAQVPWAGCHRRSEPSESRWWWVFVERSAGANHGVGNE